MSILSTAQAMQYAAQAGFTGASQQIIVAIARAESGLNTSIRGIQDSRDRGVLQINSYYHPEVTDSQAFDPLASFQAAFRISQGGTNFSQWHTYTGGEYKQFLSSNNSGGDVSNRTPWYQFPRIDNYGGVEPFGGFAKPDSNIQVPAGYPITALLPGTISGINSPDGSIPDYGAVITIKLDNPVNPVATHTAYLHLASIPSGLHVGQHVNAGDLIGYNGSGQAAGGQKVPLGFALYNGDYYGYGSSWAKYLGSPFLNPVALLNSARAGKLNIPNGGYSSSTSTDWISGVTGNLKASGEKIGMLLVGVVLLIFGLYMIFQKQIDGVAQKSVKVAEKAAIAA